MKSIKICLQLLIFILAGFHSNSQNTGNMESDINSVAVLKNNSGLDPFSAINSTALNNNPAEDSIHILDSIQFIARYTGGRQLIFVKDSLRGGFFFRYNGLRTADNGLVFIDALQRKWHRYLVNNYVNVCWYGLKAADEKFDNYPLWENMVHSIKKINIVEGYDHYSWRGEIVFPPNEKFYFFSSTITIDNNMVIKGGTTAQKFHQFSKIKFPANTTGFDIRWPADNIAGVSGTLIKDILIAAMPAKKPDSTRHGINSNAPVFIENVTVTGFSGNGINLQGPQGKPFTGSVDLSSVKRCYLTYNYDGLHIEGGDGNGCLVEECNLSLNRRWGLNDLSFLGNTYIANHAASNCSVAGQRTMVCQNGHTYAALRAGNNLKNPGADIGWEKDWYDFGPIGCVWEDVHFVRGNFYEPGGAYSIDNRDLGSQNQRSVLIGCYSESDQPPSYIGNKSMAIGGINGSGFYSYSPRIEADNGQIYVNRQGLRSDAGPAKTYGKINETGVSVLNENGGGLVMTYDTTYRMGKFIDGSSSEALTFITSSYTNRSLIARNKIAPGILLNQQGMYLGHSDDRSRVKYFNITNKKPASISDKEVGDLFISTPRGYVDLAPSDDIIYKVIDPLQISASKEWSTIKGASQHIKTTVKSIPADVETTFEIDKSLKLYVSGSCVDGGGNYYFFKKLFRIISNGKTASLVSVQDLENEVKTPAFTNANISLAFSGLNVTTRVGGVSGDWQLYITREKQ